MCLKNYLIIWEQKMLDLELVECVKKIFYLYKK